jgi:hypothetical protein
MARRGGRGALSRVVLTLVVLALCAVRAVRAQECAVGCTAEKAAAARLKRAERERDAFQSDANARAEEVATIRREMRTQAEEMKRTEEEMKRVSASLSATKSELSAAESNAKATETRRATETRELEEKIENLRDELSRTKKKDSLRVKILEEQLLTAEEAWVPVWFQRRTEPARKRAAQAIEMGKKKTQEVVELGQKKTAEALQFGKESIPKMVDAVEKKTKKVVEVGKEQTAKVVNAANEHIPKVVNAGKDVVDKVSKQVGEIPKKMKVLKELKADLKEARKIHDVKMKTGKAPKKLPEKFSTRQAMRALDLMEEGSSLWRHVVSEISAVGILNKIVAPVKGEVVRIYGALHKSYHKRFIPWTHRVRAATAKSVGTKLATFILNLPTEVIAKLPFNVSIYTVEELAVKLADSLWAVILSVIAIAILRDIFIVPSNETVATYSIMKVPEQNGVDVLIRLPRVESMDEIDFRFDAAFNEISIDAEDAGHSELISVPKCKTGIKRWAKPEPIFLEGEEVVLVELRPVGSKTSNGQTRREADPPPPPSVPFAVVNKRATADKKTSNGSTRASTRSTRSRR